MKKQTDGEYVIEHGIPKPKQWQGKVVRLIEKMKVGDSVVCPIKNVTSWYAAAARRRMKVETHRVDAGHRRVWRVK